MTDQSRDSDEPTRLARRLGLVDAVTVGLAAMIGAGIFAGIGPAADAAGSGLLLGLAAAAIVAYCNARSSSQLAALYPESGGTYVYGRQRLGWFWGYLAGWSFVIGKTASCAALALTFGSYVGNGHFERLLAVAAVVVLAAVNFSGIRKTAMLTRLAVAIVLGALACVIVACLFGGQADVEQIGSLTSHGWHGILQAGGLLFFAFAGYARIATLGEEVVSPRTTIPRAIPLALAITLGVYASVTFAALVAVGPNALAASSAPLVTAVRAGTLDWLAPAARIGATFATLGVLMSLLAGVSRATFAMAANRDFPAWLDRVHPTRRVPYRADLAVAAVVVGVVLVADVRGAIGFSSFTVLFYYGITNASAWTLTPLERRSPRTVAVLGLLGCLVLALSLPLDTVVGGVVVLALGIVAWTLMRARASP